jgi:MerR family redox-sensitive transcriptional activator SoxR
MRVRAEHLTIREVANLAGVSTNAVRYYEKHGVVTSTRTSGNARRFTVDAVCRVKLAVAAQRVGLTLADSAEILGEIPPLCADYDLWANAMQRLVDAGEARVTELKGVVAHYRKLDFIRA